MLAKILPSSALLQLSSLVFQSGYLICGYLDPNHGAAGSGLPAHRFFSRFGHQLDDKENTGLFINSVCGSAIPLFRYQSSEALPFGILPTVGFRYSKLCKL